MLFSIIDNQFSFTLSFYSNVKSMCCPLCTLRGLTLAKNCCNNMNKSRAGITRLFLSYDYGQRVNSQKRKCKVNRCKLQRQILIIDCNYKLQLLASECQKHPPELFCEKGVLKSFAKFTEKHLCQSLFFNKVADLRQLY